MMKSFKFRSSKKTSLNSQNFVLTDLVAEALTSFDFSVVERTADRVKFKHDFKYSKLESFQRRYGNGEIMVDKNNLNLSTETDFSKMFTFSLIPIFVILTIVLISELNLFNIDFNTKNSLLLISALLVSTTLEFFINRSIILNKQRELLKLIDKFIKDKIKPAHNNGEHEEPL